MVFFSIFLSPSFLATVFRSTEVETKLFIARLIEFTSLQRYCKVLPRSKEVREFADF